MDHSASSTNPDRAPVHSQLQFAASLGVDGDADVGELVARLEQKLGQNTMREQARFFLMSVLRHVNKQGWDSLDASNIGEQEQYALADAYIEGDEYKQSLRTVLKDNRCRFALIGFAKARNVDKRILSTTTKAYKHARVILEEAGLVQGAAKTAVAEAGKKDVASTTKAVVSPIDDSVVGRRAARRGYVEQQALEKENVIQVETIEAAVDDIADMSEEEYAELEKIITTGGKSDAGKNWSYGTNEDRLSLLLGIAAGFGFFFIVLLLVL